LLLIALVPALGGCLGALRANTLLVRTRKLDLGVNKSEQNRRTATILGIHRTSTTHEQTDYDLAEQESPANTKKRQYVVFIKA
jgi:hypothetical protein